MGNWSDVFIIIDKKQGSEINQETVKDFLASVEGIEAPPRGASFSCCVTEESNPMGSNGHVFVSASVNYMDEEGLEQLIGNISEQFTTYVYGRFYRQSDDKMAANPGDRYLVSIIWNIGSKISFDPVHSKVTLKSEKAILTDAFETCIAANYDRRMELARMMRDAAQKEPSAMEPQKSIIGGSENPWNRQDDGTLLSTNPVEKIDMMIIPTNIWEKT